jgi:hypothetical protein
MSANLYRKCRNDECGQWSTYDGRVNPASTKCQHCGKLHGRIELGLDSMKRPDFVSPKRQAE